MKRLSEEKLKYFARLDVEPMTKILAVAAQELLLARKVVEEVNVDPYYINFNTLKLALKAYDQGAKG